MLQQTTVTAVIPYYERFLARFPTVEQLARADEQDVLKLWEGLGYYSRARNIHKAAKTIVTTLSGRFPESAGALQELPGIGRYTAGAIASFAFDSAAPIVEANTLRLYCRVLGYEGDPRSKDGQNLLWRFAERILSRKEPGKLNQALMELGGTLCSVKAPSCSQCPLQSSCRAFAEGKQGVIPRPKSRPPVTHVTHANVIVRKRAAVLIRQHSAAERWSGLWDFPRYELPAGVSEWLPKTTKGPSLFPVDARISDFLKGSVYDETGIEPAVGEVVTELSHSVTRYRIRLVCFDATFVSGRVRSGEPIKWVRPEQLGEFPLTMTARKIALAIT